MRSRKIRIRTRARRTMTTMKSTKEQAIRRMRFDFGIFP